jgi:hypothetical protein
MSPTECGMSECDREPSTVRRPWPSRSCGAMEEHLYVAHAVQSDDIGSDDRFSPWFDSTFAENAVFIQRTKPSATPSYNCWYSHNAETDKSGTY